MGGARRAGGAILNGGCDIPDATWTRLDEEIKKACAAAFGWSKRHQSMHKLGVADTLLNMLKTSAFGKRGNKTLEQYDEEARDVLVLRRAQLERRRGQLLSTPAVERELKKARDRAIAIVLGNGRTAAKGFAQYLISDAFFASLDNLGRSPSLRAQRQRAQLLRLGVLDQKLAEQVARHWGAKELELDPIGVLQRVPREKARLAAEGLLAMLADLSKSQRTKLGYQAAKGPKSPLLLGWAANVDDFVATPQARTALARSLAAMMGRDELRRSLRHLDDATFIARLRTNNVAGADFLEAMTRSPVSGRRLTVFFSLWGMISVGTNARPVDEAGKVRWDQVRCNAVSTLGIVSTLPDLAKFGAADLERVLVTFVSAEIEGSALTTKICAGSKVVAASSGFKLLCDSLGLVGDVIAIPMAIKGWRDECTNEDTIGAAANLVGLISSTVSAGLVLATILGATIWPPLAIGLALTGLASSIFGSVFGESALTGKIREDLRYLDISTNEEKTHRAYVASRGVSSASTAASPSFYEKLRIINVDMDGRTSAKAERRIHRIFGETRSDSTTFVKLIEATDPARVADELEDTQQACDLLVWTALAYRHLGQPPGRGFEEQFLDHCSSHRWKPLVEFFHEVNGSNPDLQRAFQAVPAGKLYLGSSYLMIGQTRSGEEWALSYMLQTASAEQLDGIIRIGRSEYLRDLRSELDDEPWERFHKRMRSDKACPQTQTYAKMVR